MLATLVIVFREMIEAGLVIGIVLAATRTVPRRTAYVSGGVVAGVLGACLIAAFAGSIAAAMQGMGQEIFNASILLLAVLMLGWHNIWMAQHGRVIASEMKTLGAEVRTGKKSLLALAAVVAIAVLREGSEVVLFLYGILASENSTVGSMLLGGLLGVVLGGAMSALIYYGLMRIPVRHLFAVTSGLITLLAAGLAAQAAKFLQQGGVISIFQKKLWDTSGILSDSSIVGKALHVLVGYTDRPNGLQLLVYVLTCAVITLLMKRVAKRNARASS